MAEWSTSTTRITIDGKTYSGVEQMPPEVRDKYQKAIEVLADRDGNGVPDILEGKNPPGMQISKVISTTRSFAINGNHHCDPSSPIVPRLADEQDMRSNAGGITIQLSWPTILALGAMLAIIAGVVAYALRQ